MEKGTCHDCGGTGLRGVELCGACDGFGGPDHPKPTRQFYRRRLKSALSGELSHDEMASLLVEHSSNFSQSELNALRLAILAAR